MKININPEPCFKRIEKTLKLEGKPDHLPLCDFGISPEIMEWVNDRKLKSVKYRSGNKSYSTLNLEGQLKFWIDAGYDYVHMRPFYDFSLYDLKKKSDSKLAEGTGIIKSMKVLTSQTWPWQCPEDFCYQHIIDIAKIMPAEMKLIISTGDIFTRVWESMGFTHFCHCIYEDIELIRNLFKQIGEAIYLLNKRTIELAGKKIGAIWYTDDLAYNTGPFVNPDVYREYLFPWVKKISDLARDLSVPFLYHTDGNLWSLFEDFVELGVNAIHPLEPKSMDAVEVKNKWGDKFCLIGNVELDLLSRGEPAEVSKLVRDCIEKLGYNGGYCVGSSNTLASYIKVENFKAMVETVFNYN